MKDENNNEMVIDAFGNYVKKDEIKYSNSGSGKIIAIVAAILVGFAIFVIIMNAGNEDPKSIAKKFTQAFVDKNAEVIANYYPEEYLDYFKDYTDLSPKNILKKCLSLQIILTHRFRLKIMVKH